jgi:uncharacterized protein YbjT (DUF2867 family)
VILVAGGTGRLGTLVVRRLTADGRAVRVLTRDPKRADHLSDTGAEVASGDLRQPESLVAAMAEVDLVVAAAHGFAGPGRVTPASVDRDGNAHLVAAARQGGAEFVLVSVVGAAPDHPLELFRMKATAEEDLRRSGVPWTIVRSAAFAELYLELLTSSAGKAGRPLVFGRGENPINFVSVEDVARAVVLAVSAPELRGQVLEIGGPANVTFTELARLVQRRLNATGKRPRHVPRPVLRALAGSGHLAASAIARQAAAALVMDTTDMTFDDQRLRLPEQLRPTPIAGLS